MQVIMISHSIIRLHSLLLNISSLCRGIFPREKRNKNDFVKSSERLCFVAQTDGLWNVVFAKPGAEPRI